MEAPCTVHIVPEESLLKEVRTNFPCTVEGCDRLLPNYGALRMHVVKTHKFYQNDDDRALAMKVKKVNSCTYVYHCPVEGCRKGRQQGEKTATAGFSSMKLLKQHYGKQHAEKKFKCVKCDCGFGLERDKRRHEETCGLLLKCVTCGCPYSTVEAMLTHCRRKGHIQPEECNAKKKTKQKTLKSETPIWNKETQYSSAPPNIFVFNVLPSPNNSPNLTKPPDGFRPILPKPIIQQTVPMTTVSMATHPIMVDQRDLLLMENTNTQTESDRVEQGTCMTGDFSQLPAISTAVQTNLVEDNGYEVTGCDSFPGNLVVNHSGMLPYFHQSFPVKHSNSPNKLVNASTQHTSTGKPNNRRSSSVTQNSYLSQVVDKNSPNVFSLQDSMSLTKGMQTLMSLPIRSELSIAVAETQTPGDYILKQAMTSANIALNKQSKGSQVSPRSKVRGERSQVYVHSQSCQTSRFSEQKTQRQRKCRKFANKDCAINSVINRPKKQWSHRCTARTNSRQVNTWCNSCQCVGQCTCMRRPQTSPVVLSTAGHRLPHSNKGQGTVLNRGQQPQRITNPCSFIPRAAMLIDGPQNDALEAVSGSFVDFDDFTDHQTQTMGLLEELNSLAATISTQTPQSYLAQPSNVSTETDGSNIGTQTFVSAFSDRTSAVLLAPQVQPNTAKPSARPYNDIGTGHSCVSGDSQLFAATTATTSTGVPYGHLGSAHSCISENSTENCSNLVSVHTTNKDLGDVISSGQLFNLVSEASNTQSCQNSLVVNQQPSSTFTNSIVQTVPTDLLNLLDMGIQADSGPGTTIQTQTNVDEMWELFCHNMETQTADDILQELGFSDIQIQTNMDLECLEDNSSTVETQTMWHAMSTACGGNVEQSDMQTQTLFPSTTTTEPTTLAFDTDLTDSHTQTPWEDITALILDDL